MNELIDIGELFKEKLKNHKIEPSNKVWQNINNYNKSKFTIKNVAITSAVAVVVIFSILFFVNNQNSKTEDIKTTKQIVKNQIIDESKSNTTEIENVDNKKVAINQISKRDEKIEISNNISNLAISQPQHNSIITNKQPKIIENPAVENVSSVEKISPVIDNSKTYDLSKNDPIYLDISNDTTICNFETLKLKVKGGDKIIWSTGATSEEIDVIAPSQEKELIFVANVRKSNKDTVIKIVVKVVDCNKIYVPSAFSPNNDGVNDLFIPVFKEEISDYYMQIVSRSGRMLFETRDINRGWDGRYNGEQTNESIFIYIIRYRDKNNKSKEIKGQVLKIKSE